MCLQFGRPGFDPWVRKIPWRREWLPTPVFLPGETHGLEEPGGLQSMGSQRVRHDWAINTFSMGLTYINWVIIMLMEGREEERDKGNKKVRERRKGTRSVFYSFTIISSVPSTRTFILRMCDKYLFRKWTPQNSILSSLLSSVNSPIQIHK